MSCIFLLIPYSIFILLRRAHGEALKLVFRFPGGFLCSLFCKSPLHLHLYIRKFCFSSESFLSWKQIFSLCRDASLKHAEFTTACMVIYFKYVTGIDSFSKFLVLNLYCLGNLILMLLLVQVPLPLCVVNFHLGGRSRDKYLFTLKYYDGFVGSFIDCCAHVF